MICERVDVTNPPLSHPHFLHTPISLDFDLDALDDLDLDSDWMSASSVDRKNSHQWMIQHQPLSAPHAQSSYSRDADYYSYDQRSLNNNNRSWSQTYSDVFSPYSITQTPPQSRLPSHRKALSNSTASTSSPQQQTSAYPQPLLDSSQYRHLQQTQYYPTPTHTPTSGTFMDQGYGRGGASDVPPTQRHGSQSQMKPIRPQVHTSGPLYPPHNPYAGEYLTPNTGTPHTATQHSANGAGYGDRRYPAPHPQQQSQPQPQQQQYGENGAIPMYHVANGNSYYYPAPQQQQRKVPHLDQSLTEVCANEGYNPMMGVPSSHTQQPNNLLMPDNMQNRLSAANAQRHSRSPGPDVKRENSPFRPGSQYAHDQQYGGMPDGQVGTAAYQRQQQKMQEDSYQYWRHHTRGEDPSQKQETISPKDAYLDDFKEAAEESSNNPPLFPRQSSSSSHPPPYNGHHSYGPVNGHRQHYPSTSNFSFQTPSMPASANVPSNDPSFKFAPINRQDSSTSDTPTHLVSMETSRSEPSSSQETPPHLRRDASSTTTATPTGNSSTTPTITNSSRPTNSISTADTGTYSCTYIGCPHRFPTPALLQKHKKDAHRPPAGSSRHTSQPVSSTASPMTPHPSAQTPTTPGIGARDTPSSPQPGSGSLQGQAMTQTGPHRCDRINPSTGKPCNTAFSRPYDLTRHEDTIHARRPKVHCEYCAGRGEEKTFSRADALTRHLRVVHPEVEVRGFGGRRRGL